MNRKRKDDDNDSDDDEDEKPKKSIAKQVPKSSAKEAAKKKDNDDNLEDKKVKKPTAKEVPKSTVKRKDDDDSDEDEDEKLKKPAVKVAPNSSAKKRDNDESDEDEEDEKPATKKALKSAAKKSDEHSDEDIEDEKPAAKKVPKSTAKRKGDDDSNEDEDEKLKKPAVKVAPNSSAKKRDNDESDEDQEDEKPATKKALKSAAKKSDEDIEDEKSGSKEAPKSSTKRRNDDDSEEDDEDAAKKPSKSAGYKSVDDDDDDDDDEKPKTVSNTPQKLSGKNSQKKVGKRSCFTRKKSGKVQQTTASKVHPKIQIKRRHEDDDDEDDDEVSKIDTKKCQTDITLNPEGFPPNMEEDIQTVVTIGVKDCSDSKIKAKLREPYAHKEILNENEDHLPDLPSSEEEVEERKLIPPSILDTEYKSSLILEESKISRYFNEPEFRAVMKPKDIAVVIDADIQRRINQCDTYNEKQLLNGVSDTMKTLMMEVNNLKQLFDKVCKEQDANIAMANIDKIEDLEDTIEQISELDKYEFDLLSHVADEFPLAVVITDSAVHESDDEMKFDLPARNVKDFETLYMMDGQEFVANRPMLDTDLLEPPAPLDHHIFTVGSKLPGVMDPFAVKPMWDSNLKCDIIPPQVGLTKRRDRTIFLEDYIQYIMEDKDLLVKPDNDDEPEEKPKLELKPDHIPYKLQYDTDLGRPPPRLRKDVEEKLLKCKCKNGQEMGECICGCPKNRNICEMNSIMMTDSDENLSDVSVESDATFPRGMFDYDLYGKFIRKRRKKCFNDTTMWDYNLCPSSSRYHLVYSVDNRDSVDSFENSFNKDETQRGMFDYDLIIDKTKIDPKVYLNKRAMFDFDLGHASADDSQAHDLDVDNEPMMDYNLKGDIIQRPIDDGQMSDLYIKRINNRPMFDVDLKKITETDSRLSFSEESSDSIPNIMTECDIGKQFIPVRKKGVVKKLSLKKQVESSSEEDGYTRSNNAMPIPWNHVAIKENNGRRYRSIPRHSRKESTDQSYTPDDDNSSVRDLSTQGIYTTDDLQQTSMDEEGIYEDDIDEEDELEPEDTRDDLQQPSMDEEGIYEDDTDEEDELESKDTRDEFVEALAPIKDEENSNSGMEKEGDLIPPSSTQWPPSDDESNEDVDSYKTTMQDESNSRSNLYSMSLGISQPETIKENKQTLKCENCKKQIRSASIKTSQRENIHDKAQIFIENKDLIDLTPASSTLLKICGNESRYGLISVIRTDSIQPIFGKRANSTDTKQKDFQNTENEADFMQESMKQTNTSQPRFVNQISRNRERVKDSSSRRSSVERQSVTKSPRASTDSNSINSNMTSKDIGNKCDSKDAPFSGRSSIKSNKKSSSNDFDAIDTKLLTQDISIKREIENESLGIADTELPQREKEDENVETLINENAEKHLRTAANEPSSPEYEDDNVQVLSHEENENLMPVIHINSIQPISRIHSLDKKKLIAQNTETKTVQYFPQTSMEQTDSTQPQIVNQITNTREKVNHASSRRSSAETQPFKTKSIKPKDIGNKRDSKDTDNTLIAQNAENETAQSFMQASIEQSHSLQPEIMNQITNKRERINNSTSCRSSVETQPVKKSPRTSKDSGSINSNIASKDIGNRRDSKDATPTARMSFESDSKLVSQDISKKPEIENKDNMDNKYVGIMDIEPPQSEIVDDKREENQNLMPAVIRSDSIQPISGIGNTYKEKLIAQNAETAQCFMQASIEQSQSLQSEIVNQITNKREIVNALSRRSSSETQPVKKSPRTSKDSGSINPNNSNSKDTDNPLIAQNKENETAQSFIQASIEQSHNLQPEIVNQITNKRERVIDASSRRTSVETQPVIKSPRTSKDSSSINSNNSNSKDTDNALIAQNEENETAQSFMQASIEQSHNLQTEIVNQITNKRERVIDASSRRTSVETQPVKKSSRTSKDSGSINPNNSNSKDTDNSLIAQNAENETAQSFMQASIDQSHNLQPEIVNPITNKRERVNDALSRRSSSETLPVKKSPRTSKDSGSINQNNSNSKDTNNPLIAQNAVNETAQSFMQASIEQSHNLQPKIVNQITNKRERVKHASSRRSSVETQSVKKSPKTSKHSNSINPNMTSKDNKDVSSTGRLSTESNKKVTSNDFDAINSKLLRQDISIERENENNMDNIYLRTAATDNVQILSEEQNLNLISRNGSIQPLFGIGIKNMNNEQLIAQNAETTMSEQIVNQEVLPENASRISSTENQQGHAKTSYDSKLSDKTQLDKKSQRTSEDADIMYSKLVAQKASSKRGSVDSGSSRSQSLKSQTNKASPRSRQNSDIIDRKLPTQNISNKREINAGIVYDSFTQRLSNKTQSDKKSPRTSKDSSVMDTKLVIQNASSKRRSVSDPSSRKPSTKTLADKKSPRTSKDHSNGIDPKPQNVNVPFLRKSTKNDQSDLSENLENVEGNKATESIKGVISSPIIHTESSEEQNLCVCEKPCPGETMSFTSVKDLNKSLSISLGNSIEESEDPTPSQASNTSIQNKFSNESLPKTNEEFFPDQTSITSENNEIKNSNKSLSKIIEDHENSSTDQPSNTSIKNGTSNESLPKTTEETLTDQTSFTSEKNKNVDSSKSLPEIIDEREESHQDQISFESSNKILPIISDKPHLCECDNQLASGPIPVKQIDSYDKWLGAYIVPCTEKKSTLPSETFAETTNTQDALSICERPDNKIDKPPHRKPCKACVYAAQIQSASSYEITKESHEKPNEIILGKISPDTSKVDAVAMKPSGCICKPQQATNSSGVQTILRIILPYTDNDSKQNILEIGIRQTNIGYQISNTSVEQMDELNERQTGGENKNNSPNNANWSSEIVQIPQNLEENILQHSLDEFADGWSVTACQDHFGDTNSHDSIACILKEDCKHDCKVFGDEKISKNIEQIEKIIKKYTDLSGLKFDAVYEKENMREIFKRWLDGTYSSTLDLSQSRSQTFSNCKQFIKNTKTKSEMVAMLDYEVLSDIPDNNDSFIQYENELRQLEYFSNKNSSESKKNPINSTLNTNFSNDICGCCLKPVNFSKSQVNVCNSKVNNSVCNANMGNNLVRSRKNNSVCNASMWNNSVCNPNTWNNSECNLNKHKTNVPEPLIRKYFGNASSCSMKNISFPGFSAATIPSIKMVTESESQSQNRCVKQSNNDVVSNLSSSPTIAEQNLSFTDTINDSNFQIPWENDYSHFEFDCGEELSDKISNETILTQSNDSIEKNISEFKIPWGCDYSHYSQDKGCPSVQDLAKHSEDLITVKHSEKPKKNRWEISTHRLVLSGMRLTDKIPSCPTISFASAKHTKSINYPLKRSWSEDYSHYVSEPDCISEQEKARLSETLINAQVLDKETQVSQSKHLIKFSGMNLRGKSEVELVNICPSDTVLKVFYSCSSIPYVPYDSEWSLKLLQNQRSQTISVYKSCEMIDQLLGERSTTDNYSVDNCLDNPLTKSMDPPEYQQNCKNEVTTLDKNKVGSGQLENSSKLSFKAQMAEPHSCPKSTHSTRDQLSATKLTDTCQNRCDCGFCHFVDCNCKFASQQTKAAVPAHRQRGGSPGGPGTKSTDNIKSDLSSLDRKINNFSSAIKLIDNSISQKTCKCCKCSKTENQTCTKLDQRSTDQQKIENIPTLITVDKIYQKSSCAKSDNHFKPQQNIANSICRQIDKCGLRTSVKCTREAVNQESTNQQINPRSANSICQKKCKCEDKQICQRPVMKSNNSFMHPQNCKCGICMEKSSEYKTSKIQLKTKYSSLICLKAKAIRLLQKSNENSKCTINAKNEKPAKLDNQNQSYKCEFCDDKNCKCETTKPFSQQAICCSDCKCETCSKSNKNQSNKCEFCNDDNCKCEISMPYSTEKSKYNKNQSNKCEFCNNDDCECENLWPRSTEKIQSNKCEFCNDDDCKCEITNLQSFGIKSDNEEVCLCKICQCEIQNLLGTITANGTDQEVCICSDCQCENLMLGSSAIKSNDKLQLNDEVCRCPVCECETSTTKPHLVTDDEVCVCTVCECEIINQSRLKSGKANSQTSRVCHCEKLVSYSDDKSKIFSPLLTPLDCTCESCLCRKINSQGIKSETDKSGRNCDCGFCKQVDCKCETVKLNSGPKPNDMSVCRVCQSVKCKCETERQSSEIGRPESTKLTTVTKSKDNKICQESCRCGFCKLVDCECETLKPCTENKLIDNKKSKVINDCLFTTVYPARICSKPEQTCTRSKIDSENICSNEIAIKFQRTSSFDKCATESESILQIKNYPSSHSRRSVKSIKRGIKTTRSSRLKRRKRSKHQRQKSSESKHSSERNLSSTTTSTASQTERKILRDNVVTKAIISYENEIRPLKEALFSLQAKIQNLNFIDMGVGNLSASNILSSSKYSSATASRYSNLYQLPTRPIRECYCPENSFGLQNFNYPTPMCCIKNNCNYFASKSFEQNVPGTSKGVNNTGCVRKRPKKSPIRQNAQIKAETIPKSLKIQPMKPLNQDNFRKNKSHNLPNLKIEPENFILGSTPLKTDPDMFLWKKPQNRFDK